MKGLRYLTPAVLVIAAVYLACDSRTVSQSGGGGSESAAVSSVEVSLQQTDIYYSQSTRTSIADTVTVLVLDADRSALTGMTVSCEVQSAFGGALIPLTGNVTDDNGEARYAFRVLASDQPFEGDQTVNFTATSQGRSGSATLMLHEQSDIQLVFDNPLDGTLIYRMEDPAETLPVRVYAYRDVVEGETTRQVAVSGVAVNFSVSAVDGIGRAGAITAQGITDNSGITQNVYYANAYEQPQDTVQIEFLAVMAGSTTQVNSTVDLVNDFGNRLERILPQNPDLWADLLCADSTRFIFQYKDSEAQIIAGARFDIIPSLGEFMDPNSYSMVTSESGLLDFSWRHCDPEGGDLLLSLIGPHAREYSYTFPVADARPLELLIQSPLDDSPLEIDSECLDENQIPVRVLLRFGDNQNPIVGQPVDFSANLGQIGSQAYTDASGIATVNWHDCNEADAGGDLLITAAYTRGEVTPILSTEATYPLTLPLGVPDRITVSTQWNVLPDPENGDDNMDVYAQVFNSQNQHLGQGLNIGFRTNGVGDITAVVFTDEEGTATANLVMNENTGLSQILAYYARPNTQPAETLWSTPATVTVNSGVPANVTLSTATPRIQILGYGDASVAQVDARVVDASGSTVTDDIQVRFTLETSPDEVYLSVPGFPEQYFVGDTLSTETTNGIASMTVNAGRRPGVVQVGCFVDGEEYSVYSNAALITILAGPPAYGTIDYDAVGEATGAGIWRVRWSVHLWDQYSNDVEDSTAVHFYLIPADVCSMEGFGLTGVDAEGDEGIPGIAEDWMTYHCSNIGDTLTSIVACSAGVIPEVDPWEGDTTWVPGTLCIYYPAAFFQLPFQAGDRDDNLTVIGAFQQVPFPMQPCTSFPTQDMPVQATLIDGYGCPVANQLIFFWSDIGGTFDPQIVVTNPAGVAETVLTLTSEVLENQGVNCPEEENCWRWSTFTLNYGAFRLPDGNPQSNDANVILSRPCN